MQIETIVQSGHYLQISNIAFSPDGNLVATCSPDETVRLWDIAMGCEAAVLKGHIGPVNKVAFSNDGKMLASCSWDLTIRLWDPVDRRCIRILDSSAQKGLVALDAIAFSETGRFIVSGGQKRFDDPNQVRIWDCHSGKELKCFEFPESSVSSISFSPDEKLIAIGHGDFEFIEIRVLDARTGETYMYLKHTIDRTEEEAKAAAQYQASVSLVFSADNNFLLFSCNGKVYRIDIRKKDQPTLLPLTNDVFRLHVDHQGHLYAFGKTVAICEIDPFKQVETIDTTASRINNKGDLLARADERCLELIDRNTCQVIRRLGTQMQMPEQIGNMRRQFVLAANPVYPILASAAPDGLVRLWDLRKGGGPYTIAAHPDFIEAICFDPKGKLFATCGDDSIKLWHVDDRRMLHKISSTKGFRCVAFSDDGSLLVAGNHSGQLVLIETVSGKIIKKVSAKQGRVEAVLFFPDNTLMSSSIEVSIWGSDLKKLNSFQHQFKVTSLACSIDGVVALAGGNTKWFGMGDPRLIQGDVSLFDLRAAAFTHHLTGHKAQVRSVAFNPEGNLVASGGADGKVGCWEVTTGKQHFIIDAHAGDVTGICFTSDGAYIASIGLDSAIRLWEVSTGKLVATLLSLNDEDYVGVTAEGYYNATKPALRSVMFRAGNTIFPFDQFDLQLNRPDLFLERLGFAAPGLVEAYSKAHERRIQSLGFSIDDSIKKDLEPPKLHFLSPPPIGVSSQRQIKLEVAVESKKQMLDRLLVYCNDVPVHHQTGIDIRSLKSGTNLDVDVQLASGDNKVQLYAVDANGIESSRATFRTYFANEKRKPELFILSVGISLYDNSRFNLDYAAKDAQDLVDEIKKIQKRFSKVNSKVLVNSNARRSSILESKAFLDSTHIDDHIIILFAGHGTIEGVNYFFLPADFKEDDIEKTGISYNDIQSLLDSVPARRRLILLDTCHAGELEDFGQGYEKKPLGKGVRQVRSYREIHLEKVTPKTSPKNNRIPLLDRLPDLFADLRRDSGANVIAAAAATEYAREFSKLKNGVFTSSVIQALRDASADKNKDGIITVSELHRFVSKNVEALTGGQQRPISRRENITDDFPII